jgi:mono/diheme cytochrome c family protein
MNGRGGFAPEIGNPVFQQAATDEFIIRTIRNGRIGTAMPAFQRSDAPAFSDRDLADVLAYLRTLGEPKDQKAIARNASSGTPSGGKP